MTTLPPRHLPPHHFPPTILLWSFRHHFTNTLVSWGSQHLLTTNTKPKGRRGRNQDIFQEPHSHFRHLHLKSWLNGKLAIHFTKDKAFPLVSLVIHKEAEPPTQQQHQRIRLPGSQTWLGWRILYDDKGQLFKPPDGSRMNVCFSGEPRKNKTSPSSSTGFKNKQGKCFYK